LNGISVALQIKYILALSLGHPVIIQMLVTLSKEQIKKNCPVTYAAISTTASSFHAL
jgi:hypothetical protein